MCLQLADQLLCYLMGILEDIYVRVGSSYVPTDFMVVDTGGDERSPIILGRPFMNTGGAIIYSNTAKIVFNIKGKRETFFFKNKVLQFAARPQYPHKQEREAATRNHNVKLNGKPKKKE